MTNDSFFSHYPFFTPPPQSDQEPAETTFDAGAVARSLLDAMGRPKIDFTFDPATAPAWWDPETQTLNFRAPAQPSAAETQPTVDQVLLRRALIFPQGVLCEGPAIR
jgi:hypothetical protein